MSKLLTPSTSGAGVHSNCWRSTTSFTFYSLDTAWWTAELLLEPGAKLPYRGWTRMVQVSLPHRSDVARRFNSSIRSMINIEHSQHATTDSIIPLSGVIAIYWHCIHVCMTFCYILLRPRVTIWHRCWCWSPQHPSSGWCPFPVQSWCHRPLHTHEAAGAAAWWAGSRHPERHGTQCKRL